MPPTRRGIWGAVMTFNRLRPAVGAAALGVARAAYDYARAERRALSARETELVEDLGDALEGTRQLLYRAAIEVDADPGAARWPRRPSSTPCGWPRARR